MGGYFSHSNLKFSREDQAKKAAPLGFLLHPQISPHQIRMLSGWWICSTCEWMESAPSRTIKPINKSVVHKISSGQVILDLPSAVKELVEDSLDAGATSVEIALKEYGEESYYNRCGISSNVFEVHHASFLFFFLTYWLGWCYNCNLYICIEQIAMVLNILNQNACQSECYKLCFLLGLVKFSWFHGILWGVCSIFFLYSFRLNFLHLYETLLAFDCVVLLFLRE